MKNNRLLRRVCNLRGLGDLAAVRVPPSHTRLFRQEAVRWFKTGKVMLVLTGVLAASVCLSPSLHAGIIAFTAGNETVDPGGYVYVPITVSDFANVLGASFSLSWSSGVLNYVGTGNYNSQLAAVGLAPGSFNLDPASGNLGFAWSDSSSSGQTLGDGTTIFTVEFQAVGAGGTSSPISFGDTPTLRDVFLGPLPGTEGIPGTTNGLVTVVPEPVNWALGLFACVFIGSATVRWISNRRIGEWPCSLLKLCLRMDGGLELQAWIQGGGVAEVKSKRCAASAACLLFHYRACGETAEAKRYWPLSNSNQA